MAASAQINLREDPLRYATLHSLARSLNVNVSELAREALERLLPEFQDRAEKEAAKHSPTTDDEVNEAVEMLGKSIARGNAIKLEHADVYGAKGKAVHYLLCAVFDRETKMTDVQRRRVNKMVKQFNDPS